MFLFGEDEDFIITILYFTNQVNNFDAIRNKTKWYTDVTDVNIIL